MSDQDLEARMREKASTIDLHYDLECGCGYAKAEKLCMVHKAITQALLSVARESEQRIANLEMDIRDGVQSVESWIEIAKKREAELAQARAKLDRLHTGIGLFVDGHTEIEELEADYKDSLEIGDRIMTELEQARAEIALVIQLGKDFGFSDSGYSVAQVITHAKYLQEERARLLFETVNLRTDLERAQKLLSMTQCPHCDGSGSYGSYDYRGNVIETQCQWCAQKQRHGFFSSAFLR